jgi:hypothetical protein
MVLTSKEVGNRHERLENAGLDLLEALTVFFEQAALYLGKKREKL